MKGGVFLLLGLAFWSAEGAKILAFFPFPAKSHHRLFNPLVRGLAERGHEVTFVTPFPLENPPPNVKQIVVEDIMESIKKKYFKDSSSTDDQKEQGNKTGDSYRVKSFFDQLRSVFEAGFLFQEKIAEDEKVKELMRSTSGYDAVLGSSSAVQESCSVLQHKFNAVGVDVVTIGTSHWSNHVYGNPSNPSFVVDFNVPFTHEMGFAERVYNTAVYLATLGLYHFYYMPKVQAIADTHYKYEGWETRPPVMEVMANKSLVLLSTHFSLNYPYPLSPHVVEVAGLNLLPPKPLPKEIKKFMDEAIDGVILFSLGSVTDTSSVIDETKMKALQKVFGQLPQRVIWKWEKEMQGKPENVMTLKWLPQQDILAHKNCRLFITHCGFSSIVETVYNEVPIIGIPLFADQMRNMKQAAYAGYGVEIGIQNVTEKSIKWAIDEVTTNLKYREAVKTRSAIFKDRTMSPLDTAVYWIEYVIKHKGAPHLRSGLSKMKWYQIVLLDVAAFCTTVILVFLGVVYLLLRTCSRVVCRRKKVPTTRSDKKTK